MDQDQDDWPTLSDAHPVALFDAAEIALRITVTLNGPTGTVFVDTRTYDGPEREMVAMAVLPPFPLDEAVSRTLRLVEAAITRERSRLSPF